MVISRTDILPDASMETDPIHGFTTLFFAPFANWETAVKRVEYLEPLPPGPGNAPKLVLEVETVLELKNI